MSSPPPDPEPAPEFNLWDSYTWDELESSLSEMSGIPRLSGALPPQGQPSPPPEVPKHELYPQVPYSYWPAPCPFPPLSLQQPESISMPPIELFFYLSGPTNLHSIPGCSEFLPVTADTEMRVVDLFDSYLAAAEGVSGRDLSGYNFLLVGMRDGRARGEGRYFYEVVQREGLVVGLMGWEGRRFWLVGSERQKRFLEACEFAAGEAAKCGGGEMISCPTPSDHLLSMVQCNLR